MGGRAISAIKRFAASDLGSRRSPSLFLDKSCLAAKIVGGFLSRIGLTSIEIRTHVEAITKASKSAGRWKELARTAETAAQAHAAGSHAFGLPSLREKFGPEIANKVASWLDYQGAPGDGAQHQQQQAGARPKREAIHSWEEPDWSLLEDRRGELPAFPLDCLNAGWSACAQQAAHGSGTTPAHVMVPLLGVASGLIGVARRVRPSRSWIEPMGMWTAVVAPSGSGKTPGIGASKAPLAQIESLRRQAVDEAKRAHEERADIAKLALKNWKKKVEAALKAGKETPRKPRDCCDPGTFVAPRIYVSDATIEKVAMLLEVRKSGLIYLADELSGLFCNMGRYTNNGEDSAFWLEAWNGKPFLQERVGRAPVNVDHLMVSIVGGLQPDKLEKSFGADHDGKYARMLFCWPDEAPYRPLTDQVAEVEPEFVNAFMRLVKLGDPDADGTFAPRDIPMSTAGRQTFEELRKRVSDDKEQLDGRERDWWAKVPAHVVRLAGTLQFLDWALTVDVTARPEPAEIDAEHVEAAVTLVLSYFWPHARAALRQMGLTERHVNARRVLRWIQTRRCSHVSREEVRRDALARSLDAEATQALLDELERFGWLRKVPAKPGSAGGRPAIRWEVNPQLGAAKHA
jgi:hypothetical protein